LLVNASREFFAPQRKCKKAERVEYKLRCYVRRNSPGSAVSTFAGLSKFTRCRYSMLVCRIFVLLVPILSQFGSEIDGTISAPLSIYTCVLFPYLAKLQS